MKQLLFYVAVAAARFTAFVLRVCGRNATYLPGLVALKICKDVLGRLQKPELLICVTGTNGKTTTSNLLAGALKNAGYKVTNNAFGSNVAAGVTAALLANATLTGKPKNECAVLEVDERSSLLIYPYMAPDYLICNNLMRDSIKRNAHTDFIAYILNTAIPASTKVILNADDINCAFLAPQCKNRTYFGVTAEPPQPESGTAKDAAYCPRCGRRLQNSGLRFEHIGRWRCPGCDFASPEPDFTVTAIDRANARFTLRSGDTETDLRLPNGNIVNVYNFCGAAALLTRIGFTTEQLTAVFEGASVVDTRFEEFTVNGLHVTMILAKGQNPVAVSRVFSYVANCPGENKCVLCMFDDKADNINNSESCCWLWDLDYRPLADESIGQIIFAGKRHKDHILRAAMTGLDLAKIKTTDAVKDCSKLVDINKYKEVYVLYDNYFLDEARREEALLRERGEQNA